MGISDKRKKEFKQKYGPWAVVTGASSGIGLEIATRLAEIGLNLIINSRNDEKLQALKQELIALYDIEICIVAADVATSEGIAAIAQATNDIEVGLLVASAGFGTSGFFINSKLTEEINMLRVNCEAVLALTHVFGRQFAHQKRGGIILLSSIVAFQGVPKAANYAATKAFIQSLAEALHIELKPHNVDVLAAAPGPVRSGFEKRANMIMDFGLTPSQVGWPILAALGKKATVFPGWITKVLTSSLSILPRWAKVKVMQLVMIGMTKHQGN